LLFLGAVATQLSKRLHNITDEQLPSSAPECSDVQILRYPDWRRPLGPVDCELPVLLVFVSKPTDWKFR